MSGSSGSSAMPMIERHAAMTQIVNGEKGRARLLFVDFVFKVEFVAK